MTDMSLVLNEDVTAAKQGDLNAFSRLIKVTQNTITSIALAIVKDLDASEEVAQLVYINCWNNLSQLNNNASFLPWIRQSTRFAALNYLRDNKVKKRVSSEEADELLESACSDDVSGETLLHRARTTQLVQNMVDTLPEESREVVLLYYREEKSTAQVATLLSISEESVRKKLSRARATLKQKVLDNYGKVIFSTAPALAFPSMMLGTLTMSSSAKAATSSSVVGKAGLQTKFAWLLSGATLGAAIGAYAVFWGAKHALLEIKDEEIRQHLKRLRNLSIVWVLTSGILIAAAYEFTQGWIGPLTSYAIFAAGLYTLTLKSQRLIANNTPAPSSTKWKHRLLSYCGSFGLIFGLLMGLLGMLIGLVNSGRLLL